MERDYMKNLSGYSQLIKAGYAEDRDYQELYDVILLTGTRNSDEGDLAGRLLNSQALQRSEKKVLVLTADKCKDLAGLYYTYEFSDRIRMLGVNRQHGSLMSFVAHGLLTEEEMFGSILQ